MIKNITIFYRFNFLKVSYDLELQHTFLISYSVAEYFSENFNNI